MRYNAFISYSHFLDSGFAPAIQSGLQRLGKPWYRIRQLEVFLDETDLSATPGLWNKIEEALAVSDYLIVLASPRAAASKWVRMEIDYWLNHKPVDHIILVLTSGNITWNDSRADFDWDLTDALPPSFAGRYLQEPYIVDCSTVKKDSDLSIQNPAFKANVARISAPVQGITVKALIDKDVQEHRRTMRIRNTAITVILLFLVGLSIALFVILNQRNEARRFAKANDEVVAALNKLSVTQSLSHLYTAYQLNPSPYISNLLATIGESPTTLYYFMDVRDSGSVECMTKDGDRYYTGYSTGMVMARARSGKLLVQQKLPVQSVDGMMIANSQRSIVAFGRKEAESIVRVFVLDQATLAIQHAFDLPAYADHIRLNASQQIVAAFDNHLIRQYSLTGRQLDSTTIATNDEIRELISDHKGNYLVLLHGDAGNESMIRQYDTKGRQLAVFTTKEKCELQKMDYSFNTHRLLAIDNQGRTYVWDTAGLPVFSTPLYNEKVGQFQANPSVRSCRFSPQGDQYAIIVNGTCFVRSLSGRLAGIASLLTETIEDIEFEEEANCFVTSGRSTSFLLFWNCNGYAAGTIPAAGAMHLIMSEHRGDYSVRRNDSCFVHRLSDNKLLMEVPVRIGNYSYFDNRGDSCMVIANDSMVQLAQKTDKGWQYTCRPLRPGHLFFYDFDQKQAYIGVGKDSLIIYQLHAGKQQLVPLGRHGPVAFVVTSKAGDLLVGGGEMGSPGFLKLFRQDLKLRLSFPGNLPVINSARFTHDDQQVVSVDDGGKLILWDIKSGRQVLNVQAANSLSMDVDISDDGNYYLTDGMLLNEVNVLDRNGNKIQSLFVYKEATALRFIGNDRFAVLANDTLFKMLTIPAFMKSNRIIGPEKVKFLEQEIDPFSIHTSVRKALTMDKALQ